ncbi:MAG: hypothetical protein ACUVS4_09705 [Chloroflexaceae bacterium]
MRPRTERGDPLIHLEARNGAHAGRVIACFNAYGAALRAVARSESGRTAWEWKKPAGLTGADVGAYHWEPIVGGRTGYAPGGDGGEQGEMERTAHSFQEVQPSIPQCASDNAPLGLPRNGLE